MRFIVLIMTVAVLSGCAGGPKVHRMSFDNGSVLVLPARDVVHKGAPQKLSPGSGELLTEKVSLHFAGTRFAPVPSQNPRFTHGEVATREDALAEGKRAGADYCLQLTLGEARNAFPMTFISDFVTLEKGVMYDTETGEEVWRLEKPIVLEKTNLGNHLGLFDKLAKEVVKSITRG